MGPRGRSKLVLAVFAAVLLTVSAAGAGAEAPPANPREALVKSIDNAQSFEAAAHDALIDFAFTPKHDEDARLRKAETDVKNGVLWIDAAQGDAKDYESAAAAVPATERPEGAISGAREIQELLAKATRYDQAATALFPKLDEAYLSWNGSGSAKRKDETQRYAKQSYLDVGDASAFKAEAKSKAEKLPALPEKQSAVGSGTISADANLSDCGGTEVLCYAATIKDGTLTGWTVQLPAGYFIGASECGAGYAETLPPITPPQSYTCGWSGTGKAPATFTFHFSTNKMLTASTPVVINLGRCPKDCFDLKGP